LLPKAASSRPETEMAKEKFEEAMNKLEKIVTKLEKGDIPLEESLKLFEEGIRLSRFCNQKLDEAEKRVEILLKDKDGVLKARPFDPSTGSGQGLTVNSGQASSDPSGQGESERDLFSNKDE